MLFIILTIEGTEVRINFNKVDCYDKNTVATGSRIFFSDREVTMDVDQTPEEIDRVINAVGGVVYGNLIHK